MEGRAVAKFVRISPRKARRVADLVKKQDVITAVAILEQLPQNSGGLNGLLSTITISS